MSIITPSAGNVFTQTYNQIFFGDPPITANLLVATSTGSTNYVNGLVMAQYTAGGSVGQAVNWDVNGTNGQQVPIGVLCDDYATLGATTVTGLAKIAIGGRGNGTYLINSALSVTTGSGNTIPAAMALLNSNTYTIEGVQLWKLPA